MVNTALGLLTAALFSFSGRGYTLVRKKHYHHLTPAGMGGLLVIAQNVVYAPFVDTVF